MRNENKNNEFVLNLHFFFMNKKENMWEWKIKYMINSKDN